MKNNKAENKVKNNKLDKNFPFCFLSKELLRKFCRRCIFNRAGVKTKLKFISTECGVQNSTLQ